MTEPALQLGAAESPDVIFGEWVRPLGDDRGLPQRIADQIAQAIIEGRLPAGARLGEIELAEAFGISRTPIREALQELERDALVERFPRRGAQVIPLTAAQAESLYVCRAHLYGLSARLATPELSEEQLDALEGLLQQMDAVSAADDAKEYFKLNIAFHGILAEASNNEVLLLLMKQLGRSSLRFRYMSVGIPGRVQSSVARHHELMKALRRRDSVAAQEVVERTIAEAGDALLAHFFDNDSHPVSAKTWASRPKNSDSRAGGARKKQR